MATRARLRDRHRMTRDDDRNPPARGPACTGGVGDARRRSLRPRVRARRRRAAHRSATPCACCSTARRTFRHGSRRSQRPSATCCSRATSSRTTASAIAFVEALAAAGARRRARVRRVRLAGLHQVARDRGQALRAAGAEVTLLQSAELRQSARVAHARPSQVDRRRRRASAFVSGLCVSAQWEGDPAKRLEPWRDTGVEIRGDAVADIEHAFGQVWTAAGGGPPAARSP